MKISTIFLYILLVALSCLIVCTVSVPILNVTTTTPVPTPEIEKISNKRPLVILVWCPQNDSSSCLNNTVNSEKWRQISQPTRDVVAAAIGGGIGAALGGAVGGGIGSLSFVPFAGSIVGASTAALGGGVGGALAGGQGGAIGGALGGGVGGGIGGILGAPGAAIGGLAGGSLGAGIGTYYLSNGTFPDVVGTLNATLVPISNLVGPTINSTWNSFLSDVLLIGPEENILTLLGDYEEDLLVET
ncbi:putative mediator of RNA polymerase II transcription subunit 17 [Folsomia candida]|uniref:Uncharacterized protein n=1 Tax=Folsomia candida TaxID=158441 RepID=A0A226DNW7_FOLCA|nr:putative mediator of RNA polymerase II transcription subunit 17 [Folsomia candida]OXA46347.1 hypothetical protein Fcan01_18632 [Folsomia candida]